MYFDQRREDYLSTLLQPRSTAQWLRDRLAFPWLALVSPDQAFKAHLTPLDLERFRAALPWVQGRVLDIGCGDNLLVEAHGSGVGADVMNWGQVDVLLSGDGSLPFPDDAFDTVTILAALNHIGHRETLLRECRRVVRADGRLIVTMLTPGVSWVVHRMRHQHDPDQQHRHWESDEVWGFWPSGVRRLMADAGFLHVESRGFVWGLNRIYIACP